MQTVYMGEKVRRVAQYSLVTVCIATNPLSSVKSDWLLMVLINMIGQKLIKKKILQDRISQTMVRCWFL